MAHARSHDIFAALQSLDGRDDVVFTRLVDGKQTLVHRRLWPALAALVRAGKLEASRLARVEQEHTASGRHVNHETPLARWLPRGLELPSERAALAALGEPLAAALLR